MGKRPGGWSCAKPEPVNLGENAGAWLGGGRGIGSSTKTRLWDITQTISCWVGFHPLPSLGTRPCIRGHQNPVPCTYICMCSVLLGGRMSGGSTCIAKKQKRREQSSPGINTLPTPDPKSPVRLRMRCITPCAPAPAGVEVVEVVVVVGVRVLPRSGVPVAGAAIGGEGRCRERPKRYVSGAIERSSSIKGTDNGDLVLALVPLQLVEEVNAHEEHARKVCGRRETLFTSDVNYSSSGVVSLQLDIQYKGLHHYHLCKSTTLRSKDFRQT